MKIGIIGAAGDIGSTYGRAFLDKGVDLLVSDINKLELNQIYSGTKARICEDNIELARMADISICSIPIIATSSAIDGYARYAREGALAGGFTSTKVLPEVGPLKRTLPKDGKILTYHPLHAPTKNLNGHTFLIITESVSEDDPGKLYMEELVKSLGLKVAYLPSAEEADKDSAESQVATHHTHISMADAWATLGFQPEKHDIYQSNIDYVKVLQTKRIIGQTDHVYAGIATTNKRAGEFTDQYVKSATNILDLAIAGRDKEILELYENARMWIGEDEIKRGARLFDSLVKDRIDEKEDHNSNIGLFAMADTWRELKIKPRKTIISQTPPYQIRTVMVYKVLDGDLRQYATNITTNSEVKRHDFIFCMSANRLGQIINSGDYEGFREVFWRGKKFFFGKTTDTKEVVIEIDNRGQPVELDKEKLNRVKEESDGLIRRLLTLQSTN